MDRMSRFGHDYERSRKRVVAVVQGSKHVGQLLRGRLSFERAPHIRFESDSIGRFANWCYEGLIVLTGILMSCSDVLFFVTWMNMRDGFRGTVVAALALTIIVTASAAATEPRNASRMVAPDTPTP